MSEGGVVTTPDGERIAALDGLRGFALCGILLMNLPLMGGFLDASRPLAPIGDITAPASIVWWVQQLFFEGTMRGLFSALFGAGIVLFMSRAVAAGRPATWPMLRRLFWLFVFGGINASLLIWPGDILQPYAIAGLFALPFWRLKARYLFVGAGLAIALMTVLGAWDLRGQASLPTDGPRLEQTAAAGGTLMALEQERLEAWRDLRAGRPDDAEAYAAERAARLGGVVENVVWATPITWGWLMSPRSVFDYCLEQFAFMLLGMGLFRVGLMQGAGSARVYGAMAVVGFAVGVPINAWQAAADWAVWTRTSGLTPFELTWPDATYEIPRLLLTFGWLGGFHLAWRAGLRVFTPLAELGRTAFTGYLMQSLVAALLFSGFGLALYGRLDLAGLWALAVPIWAGQLLFSWLWLKLFRMGPLEWVWRWLTWLKRPALLRRA